MSGTNRRLAACASLVLALAAFNLFFRLDREFLTEWDSSLYATSAAEMVASDRWIATTSNGTLDYYNSKPPLNVWLIALAIKVFGPSLVALRLPAAASAWLTVAIVLLWGWRRIGPAVGVVSAFVLATSFGFIYVHSGRAAEPDAPMTLLLLLVVIILDAGTQRPWLRAWLGPILAAVFMLKGTAAAMPLLLIVLIEVSRPVTLHHRWWPLGVAAAGALLPIGLWATARWQVDGSRFFDQMFFQDFVRRVASPLEGHDGTPFFYLDELQKNHYDWLLAAAAAAVLVPGAVWREWLDAIRRRSEPVFVMLAWSAITLIIPTLMATKLPWYLNPIYPVFAVGCGFLIVRALSLPTVSQSQRRLALVVIVAAAAVAQGKLVWYSYHMRALEQTAQAILLAERASLAGERVFRERWDHADTFVARTIVGAEPAHASGIGHFLRVSRPGDYLVAAPGLESLELRRVGAVGAYALYRRPE